MSGPYQGRDLSNCGVGRLRVAINCGVLSVNRQSPKDILNIYNCVWLWVWLGHAVVFLTDLSHLWVPRCPDKRGKDVL